jgi:hypothetical protein
MVQYVRQSIRRYGGRDVNYGRRWAAEQIGAPGETSADVSSDIKETKTGGLKAKDSPIMKAVTIIATVLTLGQLLIAFVNFRASSQKNEQDTQLSKAEFDRDMLRLALDKWSELKANEDLRTVFRQIDAGLPQSEARKSMEYMLQAASPPGPKGDAEIISAQQSYTDKNVAAPVVVFIHYSEQATEACASRVAEKLRLQGIVARVERQPENTGSSRVDYFNGDKNGADILKTKLDPILGFPLDLKGHEERNPRNIYGLWLDKCDVA